MLFTGTRRAVDDTTFVNPHSSYPPLAAKSSSFSGGGERRHEIASAARGSAAGTGIGGLPERVERRERDRAQLSHSSNGFFNHSHNSSIRHSATNINDWLNPVASQSTDARAAGAILPGSRGTPLDGTSSDTGDARQVRRGGGGGGQWGSGEGGRSPSPPALASASASASGRARASVSASASASARASVSAPGGASQRGELKHALQLHQRERERAGERAMAESMQDLAAHTRRNRQAAAHMLQNLVVSRSSSAAPASAIFFGGRGAHRHAAASSVGASDTAAAAVTSHSHSHSHSHLVHSAHTSLPPTIMANTSARGATNISILY